MQRALVVGILVALVGLGAGSSASAQEYQVFVGNQPIAMVDPPRVIGPNVMVPLRESLLAIGAQGVRYTPRTNQMVFTYRGSRVVMDLGAQLALVDGSRFLLPGPIYSFDGRVFVLPSVIRIFNPDFRVVSYGVLGYRSAPFPYVPPYPSYVPPVTVTGFWFGSQFIPYSLPTFYSGGVLMVPLNSLAALGPWYTTAPLYAPGYGYVTFTWNGMPVLVNVYPSAAYANIGGQIWPLTRPAMVWNNQVYVPADFLRRLDSRFAFP